MAVKQSETGIIGDEIDLHLLIAANHDDIFHHTRRRLPSHARQFETMAVKVNGMDIVAGIAHADPVPLAFTYAKHGLHMIFVERDTVDGPAIESALGRVLLGKGHVENLIGLRYRRSQVSKLGVIPGKRLGSNPPRLALLAGVFNHDTHAMLPVVVRHIAHGPNPGVVHLDQRRDPLCRSQPKAWHGHRLGDWVAIQRNHRKVVSRQRQTADFGGASVQHVEEHAFARLHADGFAASQHAAVDGEGTVPDLESMRHAFGERSLHGAFARIFQILDGCHGRQKVHVHVAAPAQGWFKFLQDEEHLAIIIAAIVLRFDIYGTHQTRVLSRAQIRSGMDMAVVEVVARRPGNEPDAAAAPRGNERSALLGSAIYVGGNELPVPMQLLRRVGLIVDVDGDRAPFLEAEQRTGELAVVGGSRENAIGRQFHRLYGDGERVVRRAGFNSFLFRLGRCGLLTANGVSQQRAPGQRAHGVHKIPARERRTCHSRYSLTQRKPMLKSVSPGSIRLRYEARTRSGSSHHPPPFSDLNSAMLGPVGLIISCDNCTVYQVWVHSTTLPSISYKPKALGFFWPTG